MIMRIIFVDDEPDVLRGLRRALRGKRREWGMHFAQGGAEALEYMTENPVDIIVSDMRMPDMSGAELLSEVAKRWPETRRFILSGQAATEDVRHVVGVSHQFWAKPFDVNMLLQRLERLAADLACDHTTFLPTLQSLPSPEQTVQALYELLAKSEVDTAAVARVIGDDLALSAKMLQLSNSAYFGVGHTTLLPGDAVRTLGLDLIAYLLEKPGCCQMLDPEKDNAGDIDRFLGIATEGSQIADKIAKASQEEGLNTALLRQLCKFLPLGSILPLLNKADTSFEDDMSVALIHLWGFPEELVEAFNALQTGQPNRTEVKIAAAMAGVLMPSHKGAALCRQQHPEWTEKIQQLMTHLECAV